MTGINVNGFKAYKYYMAVKLHFTTDKFNVFENGGKVKGSIEAFKKRTDRFHFENLAHKMPEDKNLIQFYAANFAYGNNGAIWEHEEAQKNYVTWIKRKESIAYIFREDTLKIIDHCEKERIDTTRLYSFVDGNYPELLKLYVGKHITIETMRILDDFDNYLSKWKQNDSLALLWDDERRRIEKSKRFVKYDVKRIEPIFSSFKKEMEFL